ncbi:hypothetical protein COEREDRAFT_89492 [Coemansia reversa NRRL 1564]|uniref:Cadherin domain-containing protein n=1 Tax=Coemansia reversa (strain ATCC 12441 / NRRL 1564) TaxID=763665 RepID=A0A2G5B3J9_COERN|nr:hypothetical protein COEREDRAFT_89492 [Coemansia reversa NRRL 1564]|eukprot:PIA13561.1 hypothetical protein COEREDRAFT_89492 [Coemansia reversa NRRL 1564]
MTPLLLFVAILLPYIQFVSGNIYEGYYSWEVDLRYASESPYPLSKGDFEDLPSYEIAVKVTSTADSSTLDDYEETDASDILMFLDDSYTETLYDNSPMLNDDLEITETITLTILDSSEKEPSVLIETITVQDTNKQQPSEVLVTDWKSVEFTKTTTETMVVTSNVAATITPQPINAFELTTIIETMTESATTPNIVTTTIMTTTTKTETNFATNMISGQIASVEVTETNMVTEVETEYSTVTSYDLMTITRMSSDGYHYLTGFSVELFRPTSTVTNTIYITETVTQ